MKKLRMTCDSALRLANRRIAALEARMAALAGRPVAGGGRLPVVRVEPVERERTGMQPFAARIDGRVNALVKNYTFWIFAALLLLGALAVKAYHTVFPGMPEPAVYGALHLPDQGWRPAQRQKFYQTSQGNLVVPFSWFMSLERQPRGFPPRLGEVDLFSSPKVQARYGLLPDTSRFNPHQLPVGMVKDRLADRNVQLLGQGQKEWIGMSCAACHTGQLVYRGQAVRIDGGQSMWNFARWSSDLVANLLLTVMLPDRFDRFARRVFRIEGRKDSQSNRQALRVAMERYLDSPLIKDAVDAIFNHTYPVTEGNARTAALGRGVNGVFGLLDGRNIVRNHGPVSFPPLWFTHDYDWVQSVAAIRQPMARNITEAWGVSVRVELENPRYASTARLHDIFWMETLLSTLSPPPWPEGIFGRIDRKKAALGRYLYEEAEWKQALPPEREQLAGNSDELVAPPNMARTRKGYCARCHAPAYEPPNSRGQRYVQLPLYRLAVLGTDPATAEEFRARQIYTGVLANDFGGNPRAGIGEALTRTVGGIQKFWYDEENIPAPCREIMNGFRQNLFRAPPGYPARPLAGYWATGPFLHNGSVRTLYQLLSPVNERETTFHVGTYEFDPVKIGYRNQRIDGAFLYDTRLEGNRNTGHEFRDALPGEKGVIGPYLKPEERLAIIEYMKELRDYSVPLAALRERRELLALLSPYYEGGAGYREADSGLLAFCRNLEKARTPDASGESVTMGYIAAPVLARDQGGGLQP